MEFSTFLMILFDYDKLLNAVIYFCCLLVTSSVLLTCVFTPQTNILSDPRFILIAPLCQCLLMIFYRTFKSVFHRRLFVLDGTHAGMTQILIKPLFISEETHDYTINFEAEPVLRNEAKDLRLVLHIPKMLSLFTYILDLTKLPCVSALMQNTGSLFSQDL